MENLEANEKKRLEDEAKEREQRAKVEAERQEALKPDKDKLIELAKTIGAVGMPQVKSKEAKQACARISDRIVDLHLFIIEQSENL